ncbi:hypothetical protein PATSB16_38300 [Pandoraea thiooxydans]|uniref:Allophanate hydrolase n=1 Tax=Pandoraea thiooxydans TaxID=445709 RepID=A0A0G3ER05_9BURK|nr:biotin-dependent carboxyltransferase family protein [Pandoraea thiooxydans]AKJ69493.1 allophanate hydrolase [Pandoraea thiooxydans]APR97164.1 hypothetical protein PATSB16_38300 [Pandoraea thiooxydans]
MIEILRAGVLSSVQDLGRHGFRHLGIGVAGALDPLAMLVGNRLLDNPVDAAVIEFTLGASAVRFTQDCRIALTGADCRAELDGQRVWSWWSFPVARGQTLTLRSPRQGMRTYLAIGGGIDVPMLLNSRSTHLSGGFGGWHGRALRDGDRLPLGVASAALESRAAPYGVQSPAGFPGLETTSIRVLNGPEYEDFTVASHKTFWDTDWQVTPNSNRMGYRLGGPELHRKKHRHHDLLSHGVVPGVVQVPPAGQPIILMADGQTTGGYPKIGVVIGADLWKLAQVRLGAAVRFIPVSRTDALQALQDTRRYLDQVDRILAWRHAGVVQAGPRRAITRAPQSTLSRSQ